MVCNVLDHKDINITLETELSGDSFTDYEKVIFTGPIDKLCGYEFGPLPYRSLKFDFEFHDEQLVQSVAQLNFTQSEDWTRTTEFKHMTSQEIKGTVVGKEYSIEHDPKKNEPYYPIPREDERVFYRRYEELVSQRFPNVILAGRLADYRYYNMDRAVARGLYVADKIANPEAE
jgi:UDP-galactopyranose mutase